MVIRVTDRELELSGTPAELRVVVQMLAALRPGQRCRFPADTGADPTPYTRVVAVFEVAASDGPVRVSVSGDKLLENGSPEMLSRFASFFSFSDTDLPGAHRHHEWWEGNEYVAPDSRPLIMTNFLLMSCV